MSNQSPNYPDKTVLKDNKYGITYEDCLSAMLNINSDKDNSISSEALKLDVPRRRFSEYLSKVFGKNAVKEARTQSWKPPVIKTTGAEVKNTVKTSTKSPKKEPSQEEKKKALLSKKLNQSSEVSTELGKKECTKTSLTTDTKNFEINLDDFEFQITESTATISNNGHVYTVPSSHEAYNLIIQSCLTKDYQNIMKILDKAGFIKHITNGRIEITFDTCKVDGKEIPTQYLQLIEREANKDNAQFQNLLAFFSRCFRYKISESIVVQMFEFLKHNDIEITKDGAILGWKYVAQINDEYYDDYTRKILQTLNTPISMPREQVDNDPNKTCSTGLHVGAWNYVKEQTHIAKVLVKPENVVSVPVDYNGMKLRCCEYSILQILSNNPEKTDFN